ncbi:hypothetical protein N9891_01070 [bacterium]|nr:hypothetical protein [bacterium]
MKISTGIMALSLFASPLLAQVAADQKTYVLAKKETPLPQKEKFKAVKNMSMEKGIIKIEVQGQTVNGTMENSSKEELIYDFISADQIRVKTVKERGFEKRVISGREEEEEKIAPAEGTTILLELKKGKWVGKLEEGKIEEDDQEEFDESLKNLEREFNENSDAQLYGTEPRKIGESWDVDPKVMPGMDSFNITGGKVTMTFVEVKAYQGELCAILKTSFKVEGEMEQKELEGMGVTLTGSGRVVRSLGYLVDLKFTGVMTMDMSGDLEMQPGMTANMRMGGDMTIDMRMAKAAEKAE